MYSKSEITPKSNRNDQSIESGQKIKVPSNRSRNTSIQSINYSLIDSPKSFKAYMGPVSNITKHCKHTLFKELLSYASTSPRPILSSENSTPIIFQISSKGSEFALLSDFLMNSSRTLISSMKTFTQNQIVSLPVISNSLGFLSNSLNYNKIRILFMSGTDHLLQKICYEGWENIEINPRSVMLTSKIENSEKFVIVCQNMKILIVLVNREHLFKISRGVYHCDELKNIVPVYLLEYS